MQNAPVISIIIVNYNGLPHIDTCLTSVLKQDYADYEVIFVDNASTDGSLEYVRKRFPDCTFVSNNENLGYAAGIDAAVKIARGDYISPLNIDTEVDPAWLRHMINYLQGHPEAGAVTPKILLFDARNRINAMGHNLHFSGLSFCRDLGKEDSQHQHPERVTGLSGCSYLIKKDIWNSLSDLVADSFMANDDAILSWILALMDYAIYVIPSSTVYHKYRLFMNPQKFYRLEKGRLELLFSSLKTFTLLLMSPFLLFIELMQWVYCLMKGKGYFKAKADVYRYLLTSGGVRQQKRRRIAQLRKISDLKLWRRLSWNLAWDQLIHITR